MTAPSSGPAAVLPPGGVVAIPQPEGNGTGIPVYTAAPAAAVDVPPADDDGS